MPVTPTPLSPEDLAVLDRATTLFGRALAGGLDGDCEACPGWTRRDCANHVLGGGLRYAAYFPRLPESEIEWTRTADHAGEKPVPALHRTSAGLRRELARARDAEAIVQHRLAEIPVRDLLALRLALRGRARVLRREAREVDAEEHRREHEDEREDEDDFNYEGVGEKVKISHDETPELEEFIKNYNKIKDKSTHSKLQDDLIEHLWQHHPDLYK